MLIDDFLVTQYVSSDAAPYNIAAKFTKANNEYLSKVDNASFVSGHNPLVWGGWFYFDDLSSVQHLMGQWGNGANFAYILMFHTSGNLFYATATTNGTVSTSAGSTTFGSPSAGTWYFVVATHDSAGGLLKIQVNNGTADTAAFAGGLYNETGALTLGCSFSGGNPAFPLNGRARSCFYANTLLTANELTWLYNGGKARSYASIGQGDSVNLAAKLVSWWDMGETAGTRADRKNANNLTDNNTVTSAAGPDGSEDNTP